MAEDREEAGDAHAGIVHITVWERGEGMLRMLYSTLRGEECACLYCTLLVTERDTGGKKICLRGLYIVLSTETGEHA